MPLKEISPGIYQSSRKLFTRNLTPGTRVYGEDLIAEGGIEYRYWEPYRSKLAAALQNNIGELPLHEGNTVLYLGAAEGTTASHISDIIGEKGLLFGVDISAKVMQRFTWLCERRKNMVPVLADAARPETYREHLAGFKIDVLYQDVSQRNQAEIFLRNAHAYLKISGYGLLTVKARSISSVEKPGKIISDEVSKLEKEFRVLKVIDLKPFEKEHAMVLCERKLD